MNPTIRRHKILSYISVFPDWRAARPVGWFMAESLLEARHTGGFPTNSRGPDEDVNVYLMHLLTEHLRLPIPAEVVPAAAALSTPPTGRRAERAAHYRRNGDQRLLCLGLYGRGELRRRRRVPLGWQEESWRERELADGRACYELAAGLLRRGGPRDAALASVLEKVAGSFDGYVGVLESVALGKFGLGARLSHTALRELAAASAADTRPPADERHHQDPVAPKVTPGPAMDALLDRWLEHQRAPSSRTRALLQAAADRVGIDPLRLISRSGS